MNVAARRVTLLALFSAKSKCTVSFRLKESPITSNKDPQNVANRLKDASRLLKVYFMFKLKVDLEICSVCYITGNCSQKYGNTAPLKYRKSHLLTTLMMKKSFSILIGLPFNISRLINLQLKVGVYIFSHSSRHNSSWR